MLYKEGLMYKSTKFNSILKEEADEKPSMNFITAFMLSLKNLFTKRHTTLTAFAGSIGIMGIALILTLENILCPIKE